MKKLFLFLIAGLIQLHGLSQVDHKTIRISANLELIRISENAYIHVSYSDLPKYGRYPKNGLIFLNGKSALLFDTPWTEASTKDLVSWLRDSLKIEITGFVPNHWHDDCIAGLGYLQTLKIESWANQKTIDITRSHNLPVPDHGFTDSLQLHLGNKLVLCYFPGAAHSLDNIVVWIPSERILFAGCMVKSMASEDLGNTADGDLVTYPETIEKVIKKFPTATIVIPGHGQFGGSDLVYHTLELSKKK